MLSPVKASVAGFDSLVSAQAFSSSGILGARFDINGDNHYAWIRVDVETTSGVPNSLRIIDWAWKTTPEKQIKAGAIDAPDSSTETGVITEPEVSWMLGLGLLAMGAAGIRRLRNQKTVPIPGVSGGDSSHG